MENRIKLYKIKCKSFVDEAVLHKITGFSDYFSFLNNIQNGIEDENIKNVNQIIDYIVKKYSSLYMKTAFDYMICEKNISLNMLDLFNDIGVYMFNKDVSIYINYGSLIFVEENKII